MPGGDHLHSHLGVHLAAVAPGVRPAWPTVYRRFARWSQDRVWARLHRVLLDEVGVRGELDWSRCAIDSVSLRAAKGGH
jgi:transposase